MNDYEQILNSCFNKLTIMNDLQLQNVMTESQPD